MFALPDGGEVTVPLMRQTSYLPYAEGDGYQAVRLPYKGDAAEMLVVLPEEGRFEEIEGRLDAAFLDEVREDKPERMRKVDHAPLRLRDEVGSTPLAPLDGYDDPLRWWKGRFQRHHERSASVHR